MASNTKSNTKPNAINGTNGKGKGKGKNQAQEAAVNVSQYHLELSAEYLGLTLYKDSLRCANRALELDPKNLSARVRRGIARKNLGLLDAALADFETVLAIDPSFVKARELRDEIHLAKQKGYEEEDQEDAITPALTPTTKDDFKQATDSTHERSGEVEPRVDKEDGVTPPSSGAEDSKEEEGDEDEGEGENNEDEDEDEDDDIMVNSVSSVTSSEKPSSSKGAKDYTLPHYHSSPPQSNEGTKDEHPLENDLDHIGSGTACRFYNHNGCNRGTTCTFGHAPDSKSIRDERGKNVCLYFLIGKCKWDNQSCIYSHSKAFLTASVSSPNAASDPSSSSSSQPFTISASFAPLSGSSSAPPTRPPEGDPKGWWNIPERTAEIRDLVLERDQNRRMAHEARVTSFNARNKNKRSKKIGKNHNNGTNLYGTRHVAHTTSRIPPNLEVLLNQMRVRYYDSNDHDDYDYNYSDLDEMDSFDMDLEDELEMEQRYLNGGFTDDEVMELLCQGVKPWDDDAGMVLAALSGNW